MTDDAKTDREKFDDILRRLIRTKPQTEDETKAKVAEDRAAKKLPKAS